MQRKEAFITAHVQDGLPLKPDLIKQGLKAAELNVIFSVRQLGTRSRFHTLGQRKVVIPCLDGA